jgi:hypothetical protein
MFMIEHFGHALEIAFTLSALFYYQELRDLAEDRLRRTIDAYQSGMTSAVDQYKKTIVESVQASARHPRGGILAIARDPEWLAKEKEKIDRRRDKALGSSVIHSYVLVALHLSSYLTTILVAISTTCSLGALIYSGYNPNLDIGWKLMTLILILSYSSISWNLFFYVLLLPRLLKGGTTLQSRG